jgi:hypothetical protein
MYTDSVMQPLQPLRFLGRTRDLHGSDRERLPWPYSGFCSMCRPHCGRDRWHQTQFSRINNMYKSFALEDGTPLVIFANSVTLVVLTAPQRYVAPCLIQLRVPTFIKLDDYEGFWRNGSKSKGDVRRLLIHLFVGIACLVEDLYHRSPQLLPLAYFGADPSLLRFCRQRDQRLPQGWSEHKDPIKAPRYTRSRSSLDSSRRNARRQPNTSAYKGRLRRHAAALHRDLR